MSTWREEGEGTRERGGGDQRTKREHKGKREEGASSPIIVSQAHLAVGRSLDQRLIPVDSAPF